MRWRRWALLAVALLSPALAVAEETEPPREGLGRLAQQANLSGSIRGGYWSSSRELDDREHLATASLWLKVAPKLWPDASLLIEGWVRNEDLVHEEATDGALREGYVDLALGPLDLRLGRQIIVWGRADRINPTDNLSPRDFTLLVPDDDDQRLGAAAVKATYHLGGLAISGLWLPEFIPNTIPIRRPLPPATIRERMPDSTLGQWAARIEQTGEAVDWSVSYFDGFDLSPDAGLGLVTPSSVEVLLRHHQIRVIGADAAATVGRYGLRAEAAYTFTEDARGDRPDVKNPFFFLVLGGDRTFIEYLNINVQYFTRVIYGFRSPFEVQNALQRALAIQQAVVTNQLDQVQHGISLRVSYKWFHETLEAELASALSLTRLDYTLRPKVTYALTDRWKAIVGADVFGGDRVSFFGNLRDNTTAYAELRWSF
ncbi:MAG: hypothetical protein HY217_02980 [Candidatus Rokubacteria bacterium]|nr:hypothetical protein [Candidatus Rokubacteria bacterium]